MKIILYYDARSKKHKKTSNQKFVSPSRKSSSTPVGFDQGFLSEEQCDNTGASPILFWPGSS